MKKEMKYILAQEFITKHLKINPTSGDIVRAARITNDFTLDDLCSITGIAKSFLSNIENNKRKIGVQSALKIAAALGLHPATILFPEGSDSPLKRKIEQRREQFLKKRS
jgi:transcriptional regulator with XRE-family HTH domain